MLIVLHLCLISAPAVSDSAFIFCVSFSPKSSLLSRKGPWLAPTPCWAIFLNIFNILYFNISRVLSEQLFYFHEKKHPFVHVSLFPPSTNDSLKFCSHFFWIEDHKCENFYHTSLSFWNEVLMIPGKNNPTLILNLFITFRRPSEKHNSADFFFSLWGKSRLFYA